MSTVSVLDMVVNCICICRVRCSYLDLENIRRIGWEHHLVVSLMIASEIYKVFPILLILFILFYLFFFCNFQFVFLGRWFCSYLWLHLFVLGDLFLLVFFFHLSLLLCFVQVRGICQVFIIVINLRCIRV